MDWVWKSHFTQRDSSFLGRFEHSRIKGACKEEYCQQNYTRCLSSEKGQWHSKEEEARVPLIKASKKKKMAQDRNEKQVRNPSRATALSHHLPVFHGVQGHWQVHQSITTFKSLFLWWISVEWKNKVSSKNVCQSFRGRLLKAIFRECPKTRLASQSSSLRAL